MGEVSLQERIVAPFTAPEPPTYSDSATILAAVLHSVSERSLLPELIAAALALPLPMITFSNCDLFPEEVESEFEREPDCAELESPEAQFIKREMNRIVVNFSIFIETNV